MDDLISRQAAIKLLKEWADGYPYLEVPVSSIEHKLNELPSAEKRGEWIPTAERLPNKDGAFLVTEQAAAWNVKARWVKIASYAQNLQKIDPLDFKGKRHAGWFDYDSEYGHYELSDIIAWMPLEEPYKEEESDG